MLGESIVGTVCGEGASNHEQRQQSEFPGPENWVQFFLLRFNEKTRAAAADAQLCVEAAASLETANGSC
jgi:hypothetical protein